MNWTGGRLARHSGPAKDSKQKQHFARVKQNLQSNIQGKPPARWNILNRVVEEHTGAHWRMRPISSQSDKDHRRRQTQNSHSSRPYSSTQKSAARRSSRPVDLREDYPEHIRIKKELIDDREDGLYDVTPLPCGKKRRHEGEEFIQDGGSRREFEAEERRRRLLRKGDWIASAALAPPKVRFNSPSKEDKIGQRRRLTDQDRSRINARRANMPVTDRRIKYSIPGSNVTSSNPLGNTNVRISIGSRVVPPGISSSAKPSRVSGQSSLIQSPRVNRASVSSSIMLLEKDGSFGAAVQANARQKVDTIRSSPPALHNIWGRQETHSVNEDWTSTSSRNSTSVYRSQEPQSIHSGSHNHFVRRSNITTTTPSPMSVMRMKTMNGQMTYSSSSVQIQHPKPKPFQVFSHFRSNSSDFADSNAAQVGMQKQTAPSSQVLDNAIWQTWMAPLSETSDDAPQNARRTQTYSISPGISALLSRHKKQPSFSSTSNGSHGQSANIYKQSHGFQNHIRSPYGSENVQAQEDGMSSFYGIGSPETVTSGISAAFPEETPEYQDGPLRNNLYTHKQDEHETSEAHTRATAYPTENTAMRTQSAKVDQANTNDDPGEIWKKFVFGSGGSESDSDEVGPKKPMFAVDEHEDLRAFSMVAQQSVDNKWSSTPPVRRQHIHERAGQQVSANSTSSSPSFRRYDKPDNTADFGRRKNNSNVLQTDSSLLDAGKDGYSSRAIKGTIAASSLDSPAVSKRAVAHFSSSSRIAPGQRSVGKQKVMFTKPKPFHGVQSADPSIDLIGEQPLYNGRGLMESTQRRNMIKQGTTEVIANFVDDIWESDEDDMVDMLKVD